MRESSRKAINKTTAKPDENLNSQPVQPQEILNCHVQDIAHEWRIDDIRAKVCITIEEVEKFGLEKKLTEFEGKHYCLFHLPTKVKDIIKFEEIFNLRLKKTDRACKTIEDEFPDEETKQTAIKGEKNINYDFRYVWFPQTVNLEGCKFTADANFRSATFMKSVNFRSATFTESANFSSATFMESADFTKATFTKSAYFSSAIFTASTNFIKATFTKSAYFIKAIFTKSAYFFDSTFTESASFREATFTESPNFSEATFTDSTDFTTATFTKSASFNSATFTKSASFNSATFTKSASFNSAIFTGSASFRCTTFKKSADFSWVTFTESADFSSATFTASTDFREGKFTEKAQIYFNETRFCSEINFTKTEIEGYVEFSGDIFLDAEQIQRFKKELEAQYAKIKAITERQGINFTVPTINIEDNQKAILNLQEVRLRNPERVSFNSMKLHPNWFVNVDEARKIAFNDVDWQNIEIDIDRNGLDEELKSVKEREILRPERSLTKACNQLADNAEANRRFEEAKQFRKQAIALENKDCYVHFAVDSHNKVDIRQKVCNGYPIVNEDGGNYYCLWHNPDKNKAEVFLKEFNKEQMEGRTDFRGVVFPITVEFGELLTDELENTITVYDFPRELDFSGATFQRSVIFRFADFQDLKFIAAHFEEDAELIFENSTCNGKIILDKAVFDGKLFFRGVNGEFFASPKAALSMKEVRFDKPNNANFRSIRLRPHYFVDSEASEFNFHECDWNTKAGKKINLNDEIKNCGNHKTLAQICNKLAINYEESRDFEQSSYFRSIAMEAKRLDNKTPFGRIFNLYWFYKQTSEYGESWFRALYWLLLIWIYFALVYLLIGTFQDEKNLSFLESLGYSLQVMLLQKPEPKPVGWFTVLYYSFQTILAPVQAALLALAIRRKFMR